METETFIIQTKETRPDGLGGYTAEWTEFKEIEGYRDMLSGNNSSFSTENALVEESTHIIITTEYNDDITDTMRVIDEDGRSYKITYVDNPVGIEHHNEIYVKYDQN